MLREKVLGESHHAVRVARKERGVGRTWNVAPDRGILGLGRRNRDRRADTHEAIKLGRDILVHAQATGGSRIRLHPIGVESISRLELTPVRHRRSLESPTRWLVPQIAFAHRVSIEGVSVGVGAVVVILGLDPEVSRGSWSRTLAHGHRHDEKRRIAFHDINHAVLKRYFDTNVGGIGGQGRRPVIGFVGPHRATLGASDRSVRARTAKETGGTGDDNGREGHAVLKEGNHSGWRLDLFEETS